MLSEWFMFAAEKKTKIPMHSIASVAISAAMVMAMNLRRILLAAAGTGLLAAGGFFLARCTDAYLFRSSSI